MKVVIIGGGTAGWLAASFLESTNQHFTKLKKPKKFEVTLVESPNVPIIGAGEGSTGLLADLVNKRFTNIGINERDFLYETESTLKLGIHFKDWKHPNHSYLSPLQPTSTVLANIDLYLLAFKAFGNTHDSSFLGHLMSKGYSTYKTNKKQGVDLHSYHFDAHKVGEYFKKMCTSAGTKYKLGEVKSLNKNSETGKLESINLLDGSLMEADFWIDCSGFSKVLVKDMECGWVSYENSLPVNSALPYIHQYKQDEDVWPETLAWAQNSGWMWQIPTQTRYGCGYVYCDKFVNQDQALQELEKTTGRKIDPIRNIKFDVGRLNKFWVNNVVGVGLSSGFLEPLQATAIHTIILQMDLLMNFLGSDAESYKSASIFYNDYIAKIYDDNRDLLQLHYLTGREDTPFWKFCKYELEKTPKVQYVRDISKFKSPSFLEFSLEHGGASWAVWCWTIMGLDIVDKDVALKTLNDNSSERDAKNVFENLPRQHEIQSISLMKHKDFLKALKNKSIQ